MKERQQDSEKASNAVDTRLVETLGEIATRLNLSEIEIQNGDFAIRVARNLAAPAAVYQSPVPPQPIAASPSAPVEAPPKPESSGMVKSPMVGTAYRRASPQSAPFVELGSSVKAGDKILLVEAMKTFNEIIAPCAGTVISILVEDGQPIEYGQPLMVIE
jgi:acetyl-CoA carboxylase biotin carboxyl carrier protein